MSTDAELAAAAYEEAADYVQNDLATLITRCRDLASKVERRHSVMPEHAQQLVLDVLKLGQDLVRLTDAREAARLTARGR